jgi:hypothetical protein
MPMVAPWPSWRSAPPRRIGGHHHDD